MPEEKNSIEKLYENPKSKGFVNHLIKAYLPIHKSVKIYEWGDKKDNHKCSVCNHSLISLSEVFENMEENRDAYMKDFIEDIKKEVKGKTISREEKAIVKHVSKGAILGWTGEKTDTYLCAQCIQNLLNLVQTGLLMGDKNITWIINKMRRTEVFSTFSKSPYLNKDEKENVKDIQKRVEKSKFKAKKVTFGDLEALQQLKAKMEAEEKSKSKK